MKEGTFYVVCHRCLKYVDNAWSVAMLKVVWDSLRGKKYEWKAGSSVGTEEGVVHGDEMEQEVFTM